MVSAGVPFDVIGLSYYPFFHGPLTAMRSNVDDLATRYGKPIVIAESQYPWTLAQAAGNSTGNFVWNMSQIQADSDGYPPTPAGPGLVLQRPALDHPRDPQPPRRWDSSTGSPSGSPASAGSPEPGTPNDNLTLFSFTGQALPSVGLFEGPLQVCAALRPARRSLRGAGRRQHRSLQLRSRAGADGLNRLSPAAACCARARAPRSGDPHPPTSCARRTRPGWSPARPAGASAAARSGGPRARTRRDHPGCPRCRADGRRPA